MSSNTPKRAVLIAGPTASGKSALALAMAQAENGVIINADSMQVYRELRVVTARPSAEDEAAAPHKLYGHIAASTDYSVARWQREAMAEVETAWAQGQLPIICGGTGLYFMSLIKGLSEVPEIAPEVRDKWRSFTGNHHAELATRDPAMAYKLNPADRQRLIRALEVIESTGQSLLHWQASASAPLADVALRKLFKSLPREELYTRADARFVQMLEQGALDEVKTLPPLHKDQPLMKAIGVPELQAHLRGEISLDEARLLAQTATRQYIKRQLTWWRGQMADWDEVTDESPVI
ncbi:tRNA (adenosine(37)-N6)-dimethylallyltransferase MiaA [Aestuariivirga litoralis]|uniref:tRNA (adenosine(37)-N6)-dimethylallyltransferase MiaA n=1 Tax=Aestuariivirga litoralis TaxID=2650924 RepID=UPI001FEE0F51|nr:tRNA (adenosine(37)-N6)-dimethylallyltransferase MiaA [Aestuariivirga litoralis]